MKAPVRELAFTFAALSIACAASGAAADAARTDRDDAPDAGSAVVRGHLQIEPTVTRQRERLSAATALGLRAPTLARFGTVEDPAGRRVEVDAYPRATFRDPTGTLDVRIANLSDLSTGVKVHTADGDGTRPSVAVLVHGDVEAGSRAYKGEGMRPSLRTVFEWEVTPDFSLGAMPGLVYDKTDGKRHASGMLGIVMGKTWTPRVRTFAEAAAERITSARHGGSTLTYNLGAAYLVRDAMHVDSALSWGGSGDTSDLTLNVGFSMRF